MNKLAYNLTASYIKYAIGGRVGGIRKVKVPRNREIEVVVFSNRKAYQIGQATLFETVIIEESVFSGLDSGARDYILLHEYLHSVQDATPLLLPVILLAPPLSLFPFTSAFLSFQSFIETGMATHLNDALTYLFVAALCLLAFVSSSWWLEGEVEYDTIAILGKDAVFAAVGKMREFYGEAPLWHRMVSDVTHPPLNLIARLYDYGHRKASVNTEARKAI